MARSEAMHARLQRWAAAVTVGDGSGYPTKSVLHPSWSPPSAGMTPTLKASVSSDARATHEAVARLGLRMRNTVVVHYCMQLSIEQQCERLGVQHRTLFDRIERAHRLLARDFEAGVFATCTE